MNRIFIGLCGLFGASAVALGAVAAHAGLEDYQAQWVQQAVYYQLFHTLALLAIVLLNKEKSRLLLASGTLFTIGIVLFCGTLYSLGFTDERLFPNSAPLGGSSLILGWLTLSLYALMKKPTPEQ